MDIDGPGVSTRVCRVDLRALLRHPGILRMGDSVESAEEWENIWWRFVDSGGSVSVVDTVLRTSTDLGGSMHSYARLSFCTTQRGACVNDVVF